MSYENEFGVIDLIINSNFETRGVDAFSLSLIKAERQVRKLFTFLVFQNPAYKVGDSKMLKEVLANNKHVYFRDFINGIELIINHSIENSYGSDYQEDLNKLLEFIEIRNKLFHGQLTNYNLTREELISKTEEIKNWCYKLSIVMLREIGYDGFERNSFQKSKLILILHNFEHFDSVEKYKLFIKTNLVTKKK